jgi:hypothetical protein
MEWFNKILHRLFFFIRGSIWALNSIQKATGFDKTRASGGALTFKLASMNEKSNIACRQAKLEFIRGLKIIFRLSSLFVDKMWDKSNPSPKRRQEFLWKYPDGNCELPPCKCILINPIQTMRKIPRFHPKMIWLLFIQVQCVTCGPFCAGRNG